MPQWHPPIHPLEPLPMTQPDVAGPRLVITGPPMQPSILGSPSPAANLGQGRVVPDPPATYTILHKRACETQYSTSMCM